MGPQPLPGEQTCDPAAVQAYVLTFDPPSVVVAPNESRPVKLILNPDVCNPSTVTFTSSDDKIALAPATAQLDLRHATYDFTVTGQTLPDQSPHKITITATLIGPDGKPYVNQDKTTAIGTLPVDVRDPALPPCAAADATTGTLSAAASTLNGKGTLANASVGSTVTAFTRTDWQGFPTFDASIACAGDLVGPSGIDYQALSPAIDFEPTTQLSASSVLRRDIDFAIPINPADFPSAARMRHLEVLFSSARAKMPRPITIASPRIEGTPDGNWVLRFSSPWFGTYQAVARKDAGARTHSRHLTHRAVIGISMGGGGTATFGMRHHNEFDALAPLGAFLTDYSWFLWFAEQYVLGGFCPVSNPNCTKYAPSLYPIPDAYAHTEDFNHWWYEAGSGNGGHFPRSEYVQGFTDLSLMRGNANDEPSDPKLTYFARGPMSTDPWVVGDTTGLQFPSTTHCGFTLSSLSGPDNANENAIDSQCAATRCDPSRAFIVPTGYYDADYNPDGSRQVISFCDGNQVGSANGDAASPYEDTWVAPAPGNIEPVNFALAVDLNKNGVRDQDEPVIRRGHEPFRDCGTDALCDAQEPGYDALGNPDPNGDDYDPFINPSGTEGDHRYEVGESFDDFGLDGVQGTASSPYDFGEGDGKFTMSTGLADFYGIDPHGMLRGWVTNMPAGPLTDDALSRLSIWTDGGVRDLFNLEVGANHMTGAISSRRTADGHPLASTAFYNGFHMLPGQDPTQPDNFLPAAIRWADLAGAPNLRYGNVDASPQDILNGDGMHVGTGAQILYRIEAAFYYVAQQWPDADRLLTNPAKDNPETTTPNELGSQCEILGHCETTFKGSAATNNRAGPIAITLPPGYALEENRLRDVRYPVVYVLHGYGQKPEDLEALQIISNNFMNDGTRSYNSRLAKFIAVYIDGRCRVSNPDGVANPQEGADDKQQPECIQGGFYLDSTRPEGPKFDTWFDEIVQYIDKNYRTMPASDVTVTE